MCFRFVPARCARRSAGYADHYEIFALCLRGLPVFPGDCIGAPRGGREEIQDMGSPASCSYPRSSRPGDEWKGNGYAYSDAFGGRIDGGYRPSANEDFMNAEQVAYFRQKLLGWKDAIVRESRETMVTLASGPIQEADLTDRASSETDWSIHLRTRDRQRK